ncbi:MAG: LCP family protein [Succiniclasticum sp.]|nr:LCP family protein [Succiniclasticum sp.]MEE3479869.1 LCP family protein [Succiniclasticum sp.]
MTDNKEDSRVPVQHRRPQRRKRRLRWGRVFALLIVMAILMTTMFWGAVWAYTHLINAPQANTAAATDKIGKDEVLNKRINVLLLGIDDGDSEAAKSEPKRTDAIVVLSFDPDEHKISMISIPRDTMVRLPGHKGYDKINAAYAYGGVAMAKQTVANLLRIPIHYYALVNWQGFIEVMNIIGGVDLYVDKDMHYEDPYANLVIDIKHGYQHLDGKRSGQYVRFRSDELGDIGRVQRQQKFLKALGLQMFSVENITKIPSIISTIQKYVETDMTTVTTLKAVRSYNILSDNKIRSGMLYGNFYDAPSGTSYWLAKRADIEKSLKEVDIPFMTAKDDSGLEEFVPETTPKAVPNKTTKASANKTQTKSGSTAATQKKRTTTRQAAPKKSSSGQGSSRQNSRG